MKALELKNKQFVTDAVGIYEIHDRQLEALVITIGHRRDIYH